MEIRKKIVLKVVTKKSASHILHGIFTKRFVPKIIKRWQNKNDKKMWAKKSKLRHCFLYARVFQCSISSVRVLSVFVCL